MQRAFPSPRSTQSGCLLAVDWLRSPHAAQFLTAVSRMQETGVPHPLPLASLLRDLGTWKDQEAPGDHHEGAKNAPKKKEKELGKPGAGSPHALSLRSPPGTGDLWHLLLSNPVQWMWSDRVLSFPAALWGRGARQTTGFAPALHPSGQSSRGMLRDNTSVSLLFRHWPPHEFTSTSEEV